MQVRWFHLRGFLIGFAFGTIGLFALALLRLLFPIIAVVTIPFFWPSRFFAAFLTDGSPSIWLIIFLYILTGAFYGLLGSGIQEIERRRRQSRMLIHQAASTS